MAKRKGKRTKSPKRPPRLGPFGPEAEIDWSDHAAQRSRERLHTRGLTDDEIDSHFRDPIGKKRDEVDPDFPDRFRRWSQCVVGDQRVLIRFSYLVADETPPGRVIIITVVARDV